MRKHPGGSQIVSNESLRSVQLVQSGTSLLRITIALELHQMLLSVRHQKSGNSQA